MFIFWYRGLFYRFVTLIPAKNNELGLVLHGISVALIFAPTTQCIWVKMEIR